MKVIIKLTTRMIWCARFSGQVAKATGMDSVAILLYWVILYGLRSQNAKGISYPPAQKPLDKG
jgi:hypothetical protein